MPSHANTAGERDFTFFFFSFLSVPPPLSSFFFRLLYVLGAAKHTAFLASMPHLHALSIIPIKSFALVGDMCDRSPCIKGDRASLSNRRFREKGEKKILHPRSYRCPYCKETVATRLCAFFRCCCSFAIFSTRETTATLW